VHWQRHEVKEDEMEKKIEVTAFYERDSKRYHRFVVREKGVIGVIYVPKTAESPETLVISLRASDEDLL
jgi:hypothetical protein